MEFQRRERQRIDRRDLLQQHRVRLARQSEDKVRPDVQPPRGGHLHGAARAGEVMPAVHRPQRLVAVDSMPYSTATYLPRASSAK